MGDTGKRSRNNQRDQDTQKRQLETEPEKGWPGTGRPPRTEAMFPVQQWVVGATVTWAEVTEAPTPSHPHPPHRNTFMYM